MAMTTIIYWARYKMSRIVFTVLAASSLLAQSQPSLKVRDLQGASAPTFNCEVGQEYFCTGCTGGERKYACTALPNVWTLLGDGGGGGSNHNILSATHSDSTAASAVRGDLITAQTATPAWTRLSKGTQYQVLLGGSLEPAWGAVDLAQSTAVTGILGSANGGTGNGFTKFTGPTTAEKTFTLPDAAATILTTNAAVTVGQGGTGITSGTSGGVPYFSSTTAIASSAELAASTIVLGGGAGAAPTTGAGYTVVAVGSAGTVANNAGTAVSLARSDHEHRVPWQVGLFFESTPATGEFPLPLPANNQCGADMDVSSVSISALVKGTTFTFNVGRYTTAGASVGNLWASAQTYNTAGNNRQDFTPAQNANNITNTDFFQVNIVSITGTDDFAVTVQGRCKNVN